MDKDTELMLIQRVLLGDKNAFCTLHKEHEKGISKLVKNYVKDRCKADEVTNDVFLKAWRRLSTFKGDSRFRTWLVSIAINCCKKENQGQERRPTPTPFTDLKKNDPGEVLNDWISGEDNETPPDILISKELKEIIDQAVAELPPEQRNVFVLNKVKGLSESVIVNTVGCPIGTLRSRLRLAKEHVLERVNAYRDSGRQQ